MVVAIRSISEPYQLQSAIAFFASRSCDTSTSWLTLPANISRRRRYRFLAAR